MNSLLLGVLLVAAAACSSSPLQNGDDDAPRDAALDPDDPGGLVPGTLDVQWMHGSANCSQNTDPEVQVHAYNATTYIIRQNKCDTFEAPFIYVLLGTTTALVLDSGATNSTALPDAVATIAAGRPIIVAHSHAHGDHVADDARFTGRPMTTVIGRDRASVEQAFAIATWPTTQGSVDLGNRMIDVLAIPGHEATHIALYDRQTGLLLTGDTLYPGYLFIANWTEYRASVARLAGFANARPIAHILGAHIEMTATAGVAYRYRETFQPAEHALQLASAHLAELAMVVDQIGPNPPGQDVVRDDFIISP